MTGAARLRASIVGASGYTGGELIRLLLDHPGVELAQATSRTHVGAPLHLQHPNLRGRCALQYSSPEELQPCDVLFLCLPHGEAMRQVAAFARLSPRIIDLSADFRIRDPDQRRRWYEGEPPGAHWTERFVYGLPETRREALLNAKYISGVGCNATAAILALLPLARRGLIERAIVDLKVGSSEGGAEPSAASHHPERSGALRAFAPTGHRHQAEVRQELGDFELHMSVTSVEMVRGVLCTAHVFLSQTLDDRALWTLFRETFANEPFVRIVKDRTGIHRYPDPKILAGSNFCDVGFERDPHSGRVVVMSAIDNLMKGAAGTAVQCMNIAHGFDECAALTFPGLHPV